MAVQAQYPSNVLLLNRNGQEGKNTLGSDYSLQPQSGGGFVNQSHVFFSNGVNANPRKRGRESVGVGGDTVATVPINLFSLQPQNPPPTLVNLSQLHNQQQPNVVSTGLRLAFGEQQQQNLLLPSSTLSSFLSEDLEAQIKQQRNEIDQFIQTQGEQLRRTLADRRQKHYYALLGAAEESATRTLRDKEAEITKATHRNAQLEDRVAQLSMEAQVWQAKTRAQEVTAASLQAQIQKAMMMMGVQDKREDRLGFGTGGGGEADAEDAESAHIDPERVVSLTSSSSKAWPMCKTCRLRAASVVMLPCRHLCLCNECDAAAVEACPLCLSFTTGSVEVYLS